MKPIRESKKVKNRKMMQRILAYPHESDPQCCLNCMHLLNLHFSIHSKYFVHLTARYPNELKFWRLDIRCLSYEEAYESGYWINEEFRTFAPQRMIFHKSDIIACPRWQLHSRFYPDHHQFIHNGDVEVLL